MIQILDPSHEAAPAGSQKAQRIASLSGKNVAFISNGKEPKTPELLKMPTLKIT